MACHPSMFCALLISALLCPLPSHAQTGSSPQKADAITAPPPHQQHAALMAHYRTRTQVHAGQWQACQQRSDQAGCMQVIRRQIQLEKAISQALSALQDTMQTRSARDPAEQQVRFDALTWTRRQRQQHQTVLKAYLETLTLLSEVHPQARFTLPDRISAIFQGGKRSQIPPVLSSEEEK